MHDEPLSDEALVRLLPGGFENGSAEVNGTALHYVTGGEGSPLVLLPGWPQTWWAFRKVMPALARRHHVVAVDLRGRDGQLAVPLLVGDVLAEGSSPPSSKPWAS